MGTFRLRFDDVRLPVIKHMKCACGKYRQRRKTFMQTINPYNRNADGTPKTRVDILNELHLQADKWRTEPIYCTDCDPETAKHIADGGEYITVDMSNALAKWQSGLLASQQQIDNAVKALNDVYRNQKIRIIHPTYVGDSSVSERNKKRKPLFGKVFTCTGVFWSDGRYDNPAQIVIWTDNKNNRSAIPITWVELLQKKES